MKVLRAKGMPERRAVLKHAARIAANPILAAFGWQLPLLISGEIIVAIVVGLPTVGPVLFTALLSQDMYLAGGVILMVSVVTVIGTLISDVLLAISDPRISYAKD
jgi:peptide/nickel transport system permease protein